MAYPPPELVMPKVSPMSPNSVTHVSGPYTKPWHPRVEKENAHGEARSTRRIALISAISASPRAKLVDARPKAWHDGLGQRRPRSEPDVRLGPPERLAVFPLDLVPRDADVLQHLVAEVGQLLAGS